MIKRIKNFWYKLSTFGNNLYTDKEQVRINQLSNQAILVYMIIIALLIFITIGIYLYLLNIDYNKYRNYYIPYGFSELFIFALLVIGFYIKNKLGKFKQIQVFTFVMGIAFVLEMSLFTGWNAGVQYYLIAILPIPFLSNKLNKIKILINILIITLVFYLSLYTVYNTKALFPLPSVLEKLVFLVTIFLVFLSITATVFFVVIRYQLSGKIRHYWRLISDYGNENFSHPTDQKYNTINNQLQLYFILVLLFISNPVIIYLFVTYLKHDWNTFSQAYLFFLPFNIEILILLACYFLKKRFYYHFFVFAGQFSGILTASIFALMIGEKGGIHFFIFAILPLPFFFYGRKQIKNIIILLFSGIFLFALLLYFFTIIPPLVKLPDAILVRSYYITLASLITTMLASTYYLWKETRKTETMYFAEKKKSDILLLNILPANIAEELKEKGSSEPVLFESVSVLFTDFVGFTKIAEDMQPAMLVKELDTCFSFFDIIMEKYNLEKLKTIGDSYMSASGIPVPKNTHAIDCVLAALDIRSFMQSWTIDKKKQGQAFWQLRLGISSGPLVAGVIGKKKFVYDVWGDTVNVASRMESAGEADKINISKETYELVKDFFDCEYRGKIKAKNKGMIEMYFVKGIKPHLSKDKAGLEKNDIFNTMYNDVI